MEINHPMSGNEPGWMRSAIDYLQRYWRYFSIGGTVVILLGASVFIMETLPPRTIVMATGAEGGANYELGVRYREILAQAGVTLQLRPTAGGLENLALLRDSQSRVSVGFIQGGTTTKKESPDLESLGTVFYEPLWLFYRSEIGGGIQALRGRRLSIGPEGSGGRALALELVKRTKIDSIVGELLGFTPQVAAEKLIAGDIDAAFIGDCLGFPRSPAPHHCQRHRACKLSTRRRLRRTLSFPE